MRRLIPTALALLAAACAQPGPPPGGPLETVPPALLSVEPESGAVNVHPDEVVVRFDEVVNEQPAASGASELSQLVLISPRAGTPRVGWHRTRLTIRGHDDFRANTAYTVTILPGIADLRGNVRKEPTTIVFSTGPTIPATRLTGVVFDWAAGTPIANAAVEAVAHPDTTLVYAARADSTGQFTIVALAPGTYTVRGYQDANTNRELDPREAWDSVRVAVRDSARVEVLAFVHDTIGPRVQQVAARDSVTLRATLDKPLTPAQALDTSSFRLTRADSTAVPLRLVQSARAWDSAHVDTTRAADSARARADSLARRQPPPPGRQAAPADTAKPRPPAPKPSRPRPVAEIVIVTAAPLQPGQTYRLEWRNLKNLLGFPGSGTRTFTLPKAAPPARDSTGQQPAARDTARPPAR